MTTDPVLFLIPARGGSRRLPDKNLLPVAGIPLVGRAVRGARIAARRLSDGPHAVVCSTDDARIADIAVSWGAEVPFTRPAALADDAARSVDVAIHALDWLEGQGRHFRAIALVQPTSPLLDPADLGAAVRLFETSGSPVTSVVDSHPATWHFGMTDHGILDVPATGSERRHLLAGAFYVIAPDELRRTRAFVSSGRTLGLRIAATTAVDVDEPADLELARALAHAASCRSVTVAGRPIGEGPCFVIAEAGVNHNGDVAEAHLLVDAAASAGADAVKFQTFDPGRLAAAEAPLAPYQRAAEGGGTDQREMLARLALPRDAWASLQAHATDRGITFLSSPFDEGSADLLDDLDVPAFKVASGELTNHAFLAHLARKGRPLLVSTGMADLREVDEALTAIDGAGDPPVALFHCVSSYPAEPGDANLRAIGTLRAAFHVPAGWSDHTLGITIAIASVALGADMVEKHLTLDRSMTGPDHRSSIEPAEFGAMVRAIRDTEAARGTGDKVPTAAERSVALVARRSLHWAADMRAGTTLAPADMVALRPGSGIPPSRVVTLVGGRLRRDVVAGSAVSPDDVEAPGA